MSLTAIVVLLAVIAGVVAFVGSATRRLDPIDPAPEERAVVRSLARHPRLDRFLHERFDRRTRGGFVLTIAFLIMVVVAVVLGLLLDMVDSGSGLAELDDSVAEWGAEHATSTAVDVLEVITHLGGTWVVMAALLAAAVVDYMGRRNVEVFAFVAAVGIGQLLINNLLKLVVDRDRPDVMQLVEPAGSSFPSGHSTAAAAAWAAVVLVLGRDSGRVTRAWLAAGAVVIAVAVATSRALLGVHWVTDVVGGLALGWGWFLIVAVDFGGRAQRLGDPMTAHPEGVERARVSRHRASVRGGGRRSRAGPTCPWCRRRARSAACRRAAP